MGLPSLFLLLFADLLVSYFFYEFRNYNYRLDTGSLIFGSLFFAFTIVVSIITLYLRHEERTDFIIPSVVIFIALWHILRIVLALESLYMNYTY